MGGGNEPLPSAPAANKGEARANGRGADKEREAAGVAVKPVLFHPPPLSPPTGTHRSPSTCPLEMLKGGETLHGFPSVTPRVGYGIGGRPPRYSSTKQRAGASP